MKEIIQVTPLTNQIGTSSAPDPDALRPVHQSNNYVTLHAVAGPTTANNKFAKYSVITGQFPPVRARRKVTKQVNMLLNLPYTEAMKLIRDGGKGVGEEGGGGK